MNLRPTFVFSQKALLIGSMSVLFSFAAQADSAKTFVLCKIDGTVRTLRVEQGDDQRCRAIYTKRGVDREIGSGLNMNSCEGFVADVRKNLEEAHWACRNVKEAKTSTVSSPKKSE